MLIRRSSDLQMGGAANVHDLVRVAFEKYCGSAGIDVVS